MKMFEALALWPRNSVRTASRYVGFGDRWQRRARDAEGSRGGRRLRCLTVSADGFNG